MRFLVIFITIFYLGCASNTIKETKKPVASEIEAIPQKIPVKQWPKGTIVAVEKGNPAPFSGVLFTEERAMEAGKVRVAYDEVHSIAVINRQLSNIVINVVNKQLAAADEEIAKLKASQNSWWNRNKLAIGIVIGVVATALTGGLSIWGATQLTK